MVITRNISILGEFVSPHFAPYRCVLLFPPNVTGIKVLHGLTIRDVQVQALRSLADPLNPGQTITRDWRANAHGIWTRRALRAGNVRVEGFATDGVFLDTRTKSFIPAAVTINNNAPAQPGDPPQTATATLAAGTPNTPGNEAVVPYFVVSLHGFQTVTPSNGTYVRSATAAGIEFDLAGTPGADPLASFGGLSASRNASTRVGTITGLPRGHGLVAGCRITTSGFSDNVADARVLSDFDQVVNNVTVYGITYEHASGVASGSLGQNGSLNVTQGLLRTIENSSHWELDTCSLINNGRHGLHTDGPDSNAGLAVKVDARSNGEEAGDGSGFYEESFLGNTYLACHTNGNRRSYDKPSGSASNRSRFISCYAERNQAPPLITAPAYALSGQGNWTGDGQAFGFDASYGRPTTFMNRDLAPGRDPNLPLNRVDFNVGGPRGAIFSFEADANERPPARSLPYRLHFLVDAEQNYQFWFVLQYMSASIPPTPGRPTPLAFSGLRSVDASGAFTNPGQIWFPNGFYYGTGQAKQEAVERRCGNTVYRATTYRESGPAPATHAVAWATDSPENVAAPLPATARVDPWSRGDIVWNAAPDAGAPAGWMCVEGSSPAFRAGRWRAMASLV
ncbi:MAG: hypothetical protein M3416_06765 [Acidobacteriota bacterium]|nr:hypothetical protein [Acidobacteriota bacterium]